MRMDRRAGKERERDAFRKSLSRDKTTVKEHSECAEDMAKCKREDLKILENSENRQDKPNQQQQH